jgi:monoamine oxidase
MEKSDILIIGAGATGLMAGYQLAKKGKKITLLEARNRTGGRIHTIENESFFKRAELGAEFIHGDLPVTINILQEAGIAYSPAGGTMVRYKDSQFIEDEQFVEDWDVLMKKLNKLETDTNLAAFLDEHFAEDKYKKLRESVTRFVSGYDTADPELVSVFALREEWQNEDEGAQHRVDTGYCDMIRYLVDQIKAHKGRIYLNSVVSDIDWKPGNVKVITESGMIYSAEKLLVAMPLGVLQAEKGEKGAVAFHPAIKDRAEAIKAMGFGAIIKFLLEFDEVFWENEAITHLAGKSLKGIGFLFSEEAIPTWWTQAPKRSALLTGWLGGLPAAERKDMDTEALLQLALDSLSTVFSINADELKTKLIAWNVSNWTGEPFTRGSYSYDTVEAPKARKLLNEPVEDTLYFAGEYLYDGPAMGTVEAALTSGVDVAEKMLG